jgi:Family of unknown function (DUF5686)/CarboxypepD_reg-like domain
MRIFLSFLVLLFSLIGNVNGQKTVVYGKITDASSNAPIPYVNIVFKGTYTGTNSDLNGNFNLSSADPTATIEVTAVGYRSQLIPIKLKQSNKIDVALAEDIISLGEISVKPGENPAIPLFRKIIARKKENNTANFPSWQSKLYAKSEIDIKNVNRSLSKKKLLKQFNFVFKYIDSLEIQGKTFLPVFFTETVSSYSHNSISNTNKEEILASKISGITSDMISQFTGKMYEGINVYDNYIMISDVGLISPLNSLGLQFYHYYLRDSAMVKGRKIYEISFKPRQALDPTFKGKFWVEDESFALTKVDMQLSTKANVNFLNNFQYSIEFQSAENRWVPLKEALIADLDIKKDKNSEMMGFMGRKTNIYQDFKFVEVAAPLNAPKNLIVVDKNAMLKDENFWMKSRPIELQKRESGIYAMVDSIQNVPLYKTIAEYIYMFYYGYRDLGKIELGPYYSAYSTNKIEGNRFRIGGRTTMKFDQKWRLKGYGAYGTSDDDFKYGGGIEYFFSKKPRIMIAVSGSHDYQLMGLSSNAFTRDNFLTSALSKAPYSKLNMIDRFDITFDKDWVRGLSNQLTFTSSTIKSGPFVPFVDAQGNQLSSIRTGEITFNTRFAPKETIVIKGFERSIFGIFNPVLNVSVTGGLKGFLGGEYPYLKLNANFADKLAVNPFGYITYYVQAGKIYGKVPWPLMKIHEGNESYAFDAYAFNLMNHQEFVSDTYVSLFLEHHLQGFFLNKIPLFQRLKWREVLGVRSLMGNYEEAQHTSLVFPAGMKGLKSTPYTEFSAGIENILKIIRVDAVWRYNYNQDRKIQLGLLFSLQLTL